MKEYPKSDLLFFRDQLIGQILVTLALFFPYVYKESEVHQGIDKVNGVWSSIYSTQSERLISFFTKLSASSNMNRLGILALIFIFTTLCIFVWQIVTGKCIYFSGFFSVAQIVLFACYSFMTRIEKLDSPILDKYNLYTFGILFYVILALMLVVCFITIFNNRKLEKESLMQQEEQLSTTSIQTDSMEDLREYKKLLDDGVITAEEFNKIKADYLSKN
ncbi:MAG: SHOCT domain-containing protein [Faecousia sp.]